MTNMDRLQDLYDNIDYLLKFEEVTDSQYGNYNPRGRGWFLIKDGKKKWYEKMIHISKEFNVSDNVVDRCYRYEDGEFFRMGYKIMKVEEWLDEKGIKYTNR